MQTWHLLLLYGIFREEKDKTEFPDLEAEFKPSLINTTMYVIAMAMQVSTFAVNYKVSSRGCENADTVVPLLKDTLWRGHPSRKGTNSF